MLECFCLIAVVGFFTNALLHLFLIVWSSVGICYLNYGEFISLSRLEHLDR